MTVNLNYIKLVKIIFHGTAVTRNDFFRRINTQILYSVALYTISIADQILRGQKPIDFAEHDLSWSNKTTDDLNSTNCLRALHSRPSTSSLPPEAYFTQSPPTPPESNPTSPLLAYTRPGVDDRAPTPPQYKPTQTKGKFPTTPPPQKKNKLHPEAFQVYDSIYVLLVR